MSTLFDIPAPGRLWVAVRSDPLTSFPAFIDWESVGSSLEECEAYAREWHGEDDVVICEFSPALVPVKEIASEYTRQESPVEDDAFTLRGSP